MFDKRGSIWRRWDLHVHTPDSLFHRYSGSDPWPSFIKALGQLPSDIKVLGINDYLFLDGYRKVIAAKNHGDLPNIDLILPVVELRLDKFGGSKSKMSRVNFHAIFSNELSPDEIETQFIAAISSSYVLAPEYDAIRVENKWAAVPTRQSLEKLGTLIIQSVPEGERSKFGSPITEGFNNLCFNLDAVRDILARPHFEGRVITAVGKTEWADLKWNDHSIADKKTVINGADIVFTAANSAGEARAAQSSLTQAAVNDRLLDCSDAHGYAEASDKDHLGNCFTWIKADPTFEGLRQALFEYESRVALSDERPLEPLLQLREVFLDFPSDTRLRTEESADDFCFRGTHAFAFSPYLTCIIGGRGTGKSTLLNLIHEKISPKATDFFRHNSLEPNDVSVHSGVRIEGVSDERSIEFLQQNEVEQFASDHRKLTEAVFSRLRKLEGREKLESAANKAQKERAKVSEQVQKLSQRYALSTQLDVAQSELGTQRDLVQSFQSERYREISDELAKSVKELQSLRVSRERLDNLTEGVQAALKTWQKTSSTTPADNGYEAYAKHIVAALEPLLNPAARAGVIAGALNREQELATITDELRARLGVYLQERGLSEENLADVGRANEAIVALETRIDELNKAIRVLDDELKTANNTRQPAADYEEAIVALLGPINEELSSQGAEVRPIALQYGFDWRRVRDAMITRIVEMLGPIENRSARPDYVGRALENVDLANLPADKQKAIEQISPDAGVYARRLRELFAEGINYELLLLHAENAALDVETFGTIAISYDGKPLDRSSFGQRCTAVIVVLLLLGNTPIIIDEPEAHLDSSLIAKYLVRLVKGKKNHRQIIFATHNANFVVNGDAELVHCLQMGADSLSRRTSATIEDLTNRDLLLALEGGQQAFQQRERRYGID